MVSERVLSVSERALLGERAQHDLSSSIASEHPAFGAPVPSERPSTGERLTIPVERASVANSNSVRPSARPVQPAATSSSDPWHEYVGRIQEAPESGTVRGLYFGEIMRLVPWLRASNTRRYLPFSKYPLREYMQLLVDAGRAAHPSKTPHNALQALGLTTYSTFASSIAGMSLLSSMAIDVERVLELAPRAYPLTITPGSVEIVSRTPGEAIVQLRNMWTFPESYHVGVWLGAMEILSVEGTIDVIRHGWCNVDFHLRWTRNGRS
jgi:uncharacterized protein (TIGR02265 family)